MNDPEAVKAVLHEDIWKKVMGLPAEYQTVRTIVERLDVVRQASESPQRKAAEQYLENRLEKFEIDLEDFQEALVPGDPDASRRNITELVEQSTSTNWRKYLTVFGYAAGQANDLYALAMDPARGGLAAANQEVEQRIRGLGDVLAVTNFSDPRVRQALVRASIGGTLNDEAEETKVVPEIDPEKFEKIFERTGQPALWKAFELYVSDQANIWTPRGGTPTPFNSLRANSKQAYIRNFMRGLRDRHERYGERLGMLGMVYRNLTRGNLNDFETELLAQLGVTPNGVNTRRVKKELVDFPV